MELTDIFTTIKKRWLTVVALAVVGLVGGIAISFLSPKAYSSTTQLFVSVQTSDGVTASDLAQGSSAAQLKVRSYVEVVSSTSVLQPVVDELHLPYSTGALASKLTVTARTNTVIVLVSVSDADPQRAATIANAVGKSFSKVVMNDLESSAADNSSSVKIETIQPATAAHDPSSPNIKINVAIGLILGMLLGVGIAVLRESLDTRIHSPRDIEALGGSAVIGTIGFNPDEHERALVMQLEPRSPRAEAYRSLRTNLQFVDLEGQSRCFVVSSALPGEGKTTTTANLAIALAENGMRVALVDADLRRPRIAAAMGVDGTAGLTDVLIARAELDDVLQPWGRGGLVVLPAGQVPPNPSELLGSQGMRALLSDLNAAFDYVLLDAPPLLPVTDAAVLSSLTGGVLLVTAAGSSQRSQFKAAVAKLEQAGSRDLGVIVSKVPLSDRSGYGYGGYYGYAEDAQTGALPPVKKSRRAVKARH